MIERQVIVTWYTPEEKLPPVGQFVIATISGKGEHITYDHSLTLAEWYEDGWALTDDTKIKEFTVHAWCDLEPYGG
jgi:hypothetical protein